MKLLEALKIELGLRVSNGSRWLVVDEVYRLGGEFVVYERKYGARKTTEIYRGTDEEDAVMFLLKKEDE